MRYICSQCREDFVGAHRWCHICGGEVVVMRRSVEDDATVRRLRVELLSQFAEDVRDNPEEYALPIRRETIDAAATAARGDSTLEELATLADDLAWDSWSFVTALGIESGDVRAGDLTRADLATLQRLNGGLPFRYDLDGWST